MFSVVPESLQAPGSELLGLHWSAVSTITEEFRKRQWLIRVSMIWLSIKCDLQYVNKGAAADQLLSETGLDPERTEGVRETMGDHFSADPVSWFNCPKDVISNFVDRMVNE